MTGPPKLFDRRLYALRRRRAAATDFLVRDVAAQLAARVRLINRPFANAVELASRHESFAELRDTAETWTRTSLAPGGHLLPADEEALPFAPASFDLVASILSLQAVNDLPGALVQIRRILKPDGVFLGAMFGGETLTELRDAFAQGELQVSGGVSPRVAPSADIRDLGGLLQRAGFASPVADLERTIAFYRSFPALVQDLRALGETNILQARSRRFLRRDILEAALRYYRQHHSAPDGRLKATFDILYLTGRAPDESSARTRLAKNSRPIESRRAPR